MKKNRLPLLLTALPIICAGTTLTAQVAENSAININVTELGYTVKQGQVISEAGAVVERVLDVLADKFTKEEPGYSDAVRASVIKALGDVRRFRVNDGFSAIPDGLPSINLDGVINYISVTGERRRDGDKERKLPEYYAQIGVTLNLKDPFTGELLGSEVFEVNKNSWTLWKTQDSAIRKALEKLRTVITKYYNSAYPYTAGIIERSGDNKLYLDLGSVHGLRKGTHFSVYGLGSIGGKQTRNEIGRLKVKRIEGDEISLCNIISGAQAIRNALDSGTELLIVSTD